MNERIRQLYYECQDESQSTEQCYQKFAELIVQECISSVGSQADKAYLRKHFGLPVESDIIYPATDKSWSIETQYKRKYNLAPDPQDSPDLGGRRQPYFVNESGVKVSAVTGDLVND